MLAKRMKFIEPSAIRKMFEMGSKMKDPVDLSLGQPDFEVPAAVRNAAVDAINNGHNRYTVTAGIPELRQVIFDSLAKEKVTPEAVMVTAGASGALVLALLAMADETTEVLVPDPCFVSYGHMVFLTGAKIRKLDTYPDFRLKPERLEQAISESRLAGFKNQILLFNSPVNPTGVVYSSSEQSRLAEVTKRFGVQVISDEVYERFCYDAPHESWLKFDSTAILVRTFGKTTGMPGWRSGFAAGPKEVIDAMIKLQQFTFVCVNTPAQWGSVAAMKTEISDLIAGYKVKRDRLYENLKDSYELFHPEGAFYAYPSVPGGKSEKFFEKCIEHEILIVPGQAFSQHNSHFRMSYGVADKVLDRGIEILLRIARSL